MSLNEDLAEDIRRYAVDLGRFDASVRREILKILEAVQKQILAELMSANLTAGQEARLQALLATINATIDDAYGRIAQVSERRLTEVAALTHDYVVAKLGTTVPIEYVATTLTPQQLAAVASNVMIDGAIIKDWWTKESEDTKFNFARTIRTSMVQGEDINMMVARVRGKRGKDGVKGLMELTRSKAETLVRTAVSQTANQATLSVYEENSDLIRAVQQISTLDLRTSVTCRSYAGKVWTLPDYEPEGHDLPFNSGPPRHFGCRSRLVPVTRTWKELGIQRDEIPATTRASMDGQVAADLSMDAWMKKRSDGEIDAMLGAGRAKLWRDGKLTLEQMVDQTGRPLSVQQLREKYGL